MGNTFKPITVKETSSIQLGDICVGISSMQGCRREMEDGHIHEIIDQDHLFLGVFDGHGGIGCVQYVCGIVNEQTGKPFFEETKGLIQILKETDEFEQYIREGKQDINLLEKAITNTFIQIDKQMKEYLVKPENHFKAYTFGGCTGCVVVVTPDYIMCANAGDSRATMSNIGSQQIELSKDHKPENEVESKRIQSAGGYVQHGRVDGNLAVSRGLGDFEFKDNSTKEASEQKVSCVPEFIIKERKSLEEEMIIIACDGLWDVFSNDEAINEVRQIWHEGETDIKLVAEEMLDKSLDKGSTDNISAIVIKFPNAIVQSGGGGGGVKERREKKAEQERLEKLAKEQAEQERLAKVKDTKID
jgi:protein phosphatase 2C family protein 2/3